MDLGVEGKRFGQALLADRGFIQAISSAIVASSSGSAGKPHGSAARPELPVSGGNRGIAMVGRELYGLVWEGPCPPRPQHDNRSESDSSKVGWGAHCNGVSTGGLWSQSEQFLYINCLELLVGSFAIKCFAKDKTNIHIQLLMDNVTALTFINKMGEPNPVS